MLQRNILDFRFASSRYHFYFYTFVTDYDISLKIEMFPDFCLCSKNAMHVKLKCVHPTHTPTVVQHGYRKKQHSTLNRLLTTLLLTLQRK